MVDERAIAAHYATGDLLARLDEALRADGVDPGHPAVESLAPYDQLHGRGIEATEEIAGMMAAGPGDHLLDVGSGLGGPARWIAQRFGCRVTGIDLTPEFVDVARELTRRTGLHDRVRFETGNALAMPFADGSFDGAWSMNVSMNIADKAALYREIGRVLKPGGWLVVSELAKGAGGAPDYPTPWARTAEASFLATPDETRRGLADAGFDVVRVESTVEKHLAFAARSRAIVERGGKPPHRAVLLLHGDIARQAIANTSRALADGRLVPIEVLARKRGAAG